MDALINSFFLVLVSEMGDKTQLLALVLALRFKKPWAIMAGILVATLLNHGLASWLGGAVSGLMAPQTLKYALAAIFIGFAAWILVPDADEGGPKEGDRGAFLTTVVAFFLAEMGDKTQLATVALGARYASPLVVTAGTTLGMLVSDGLAVAFGEKLTQRIPLKYVRVFAALSFFAFGVYTALS
jgi:putative Ca2+/H+ antiporter (TMEM165/GDT1 family)